MNGNLTELFCLYFCPVGSGNAVIEAVRVLTDHGVQTSHIILLSLFSTPNGK